MDHEMGEENKQDIEERVREGVKALFEQILEEEMDQHVGAKHYQRTSKQNGERNEYYERDLLSGAGQIH